MNASQVAVMVVRQAQGDARSVMECKCALLRVIECSRLVSKTLAHF